MNAREAKRMTDPAPRRLEGCCRSQTPRAGTDMTAQIEAVDFFAFDNSYARLPD
jgi:hypothetical protein